MIGFSKDKFCIVSDITIKADSIAVNRGYGAFDFFGVINGEAFYLQRHLDRFNNTMRLLRLRIAYTPGQLLEIIEEVIQKNKERNFYIKLFAYPANSFQGKEVESDLYAIPIIMPLDIRYDYRMGNKLISKEYQRFLPEAKSTNYLPLIYWQNEIDTAGAIDVLYYSDGCVRETSRGNIFIVKDGCVTTPHEKILKGVSRSVVLDILEKLQVPFIEGAISMEDLLSADEVFLSSTTKKILPVNCINESIIGNAITGDVTKLLIKHFELVQQKWGL